MSTCHGHAVWRQCDLFAFPYYLLGGALAGLMAATGHEYGWKPPLLILPVMGMAFLFYRFFLARFVALPVAAVTAGALQTVKTRSA